MLTYLLIAAFFLFSLFSLFVVPFMIFGFLISQLGGYRREVKALAKRKGWQSLKSIESLAGSPFPMQGQLPNGRTWHLRSYSMESANYIWKVAIPGLRGEASIYSNGARVWGITTFSDQKQYRGKSPQLQRSYFLATTNEQILDKAITPAAEALLLSWPRQSKLSNIRRLQIRLTKGELRLQTRVGYTSENVDNIVALGSEIAMALEQFAP